MPRYDYDLLIEQASAILAACGMPQADARLTVTHSMEAEIQGNVTHGWSLIQKRMRQFADGAPNPRAQIAIDIRDTAGVRANVWLAGLRTSIE